ncbi:MAG: YcxB family protein [Planctomycetes bacterium]|nr:YcxB family protein [Planctomycetota bacterium]
MDRIEYKMLFKITDHKGAIMNRMLNSRSFQVYLIFHILLLITIGVLAQVYGDSRGGGLLIILFYVCLAALAVPFLVPSHQARIYIKVYNKYGEALYFMDKEKYGFKSDLLQMSLKWKMFSSIYETKKYIFMKRIDGQCHVIFKNCLPDEKVMAIKKILANTPIVDKEMLPEEELSES